MIKTFEISNQVGDKVLLMDLGARLVSWQTELQDESREIILHYPDLQDYYLDDCYLGAVAGPYANRIGGANASIKGQTIKLNANQGNHHLHGGKNALDACVWQVKQQSQRAITFSYWIEDGFNGYPGAMTFEVEYRLAEQTSQLKINFNVVTEKPTIIGPTGHAYFNLSGSAQSIDDHKLEIMAQQFTELDKESIPTGIITEVANTELDFRQVKPIGSVELDHNFIANAQPQGEDNLHAVLTSPCQQLSLTVSSNYPGAQVYSGDYLHGKLSPRQGLCIEPQFYPDSPNQPHFPFSLTEPGQVFNKKSYIS